MDDIGRILAGGDAAAPPKLAPADDDTLLVSRAVAGGAPALFVYRDDADPDRPSDCGWTLLAGTESDAAMGDPEQFTEQTVAWALEHDPGLASILGAPPDSSFERDSKEAAWVELIDE